MHSLKWANSWRNSAVFTFFYYFCIFQTTGTFIISVAFYNYNVRMLIKPYKCDFIIQRLFSCSDSLINFYPLVDTSEKNNTGVSGPAWPLLVLSWPLCLSVCIVSRSSVPDRPRPSGFLQLHSRFMTSGSVVSRHSHGFSLTRSLH